MIDARNEDEFTVYLGVRNADQSWNIVGIMSLAEARRCVARSTDPGALTAVDPDSGERIF